MTVILALPVPALKLYKPQVKKPHHCENGNCRRSRRHGERFCWIHRYKLLKKMKADGYLQPVPKVSWTDEPRVLVNEDQLKELDFRVIARW